MSTESFSTNTLQTYIRKWRERNFPARGLELERDSMAGVAEEVGELHHWWLKHKQGIRNVSKEIRDREMRDAVGDIIIYLMGVCDANEWQVQDVLEETVNKVVQRDWKHNPAHADLTEGHI